MKRFGLSVAALSCCTPAFAHDAHTEPRAYDHAPIGVMGDHLHKKGEFMLSARYMRMEMEGNRIGTTSVTPEQIVTTVPNQFAGQPMQPQTLRVLPTEMPMDMYMLGAMYAPSDSVTLMVMAMYGERSMDHITFQDGAGTNRLGEFTTRSSDFGDTKVAALVHLFDNVTHKIHFNAGISVPTGSTTEEDTILTPMGGTPMVRLPYQMQLGSGTWDLEPGVTYSGHEGSWNWGAQARATIRLGDNSSNYSLGDIYEATSWLAYGFTDSFSVSTRLKATTQGTINGQDPRIVAPVQTAQTNLQGGDRLDMLFGANYLFKNGALKGNRLGIEAGFPVTQDLNGPHLETDFTLTVGWQLAF
ncbi:transporter [Kordiimonas aquimaris]|uniref:transporter n=1 Tax=Kordiimonas aquimaris TaxID=707591 RepID=UPI0021D059A4|nr:transporter [Kordiimonas aquimaris]